MTRLPQVDQVHVLSDIKTHSCAARRSHVFVVNASEPAKCTRHCSEQGTTIQLNVWLTGYDVFFTRIVLFWLSFSSSIDLVQAASVVFLN